MLAKNERGRGAGTVENLKPILEELRNAVKKDPNDKVSWNNLGVVYSKMGDLEKAIPCFDRALRIDKNYAEAWNNRGEVLYKLGNYREALESFEYALRGNPRYENAWYNKAVVLHALGDDESALENLDMVLSLNPEHDTAIKLRDKILRMRVRERKVWLFLASDTTWEAKKRTGSVWSLQESPAVRYLRDVGEGDIILAYRRTPHRDINAIFVAKSWMFIDEKTAWKYKIAMEFKFGLKRPLKIERVEKKLKILGVEIKEAQPIIPLSQDAWEVIREEIVRLNPGLSDEISALEGAEKIIKINYHINPYAIMESVPVSLHTIHQIQAYLKGGKNILVYGPPNSGKMKLVTLIADQICGKVVDAKGRAVNNYTEIVASPDMSREELLGKNGVVLQCVEKCKKSLERVKRPHYLIVHKIERADPKGPIAEILAAMRRGHLGNIKIPKEFRILATADVVGDVGDELVLYSGDFAFVEHASLPGEEEYQAIPRIVHQYMMELGIHRGLSTEGALFDGDVDGSVQRAYDKLMKFVSAGDPHVEGNAPRGVRTYISLPTSVLVDCMIAVINSPGGYDKDLALQNAIISNILPRLSALDRNQLINIMLKAVEVFGYESDVVKRLDMLIARKPAQEIEIHGSAEREGGEFRTFEEEIPDGRELEGVEVNYKVDIAKIKDILSIDDNVINQIITNLESGRNVILYGPPGCGKTRLATLIAEQICGTVVEGNNIKPNYTLVTANAEWGNYDMIGGLSPYTDKITGRVVYTFKDGCVTQAVKNCLRSLKEYRRPHYLIIDEFNRANLDEAFGKLFTVFEYRDQQPLVSKEEAGYEVWMPKQFRIIGTMNAQDKSTLFELGYALMRRFAFIEITLPDKKDEYERFPHFVVLRMKELGLSIPNFKGNIFNVDESGEVRKCFEMLMKFVEEEDLPEETEIVARGVRTYRKIGTANLLDTMICVINAPKNYPKRVALEDGIIANILPQLEGIEKGALMNIKLKADQIFGEKSRVSRALDRMIRAPISTIFA